MDDFWHRSESDHRGAGDDQAHAGCDSSSACGGTCFNCSRRPAGRNAGVPAKGLTGQAYEGHYFWDMEIYVMPFLIYTAPRIAEPVEVPPRHARPGAGSGAGTQPAGALFPWRTISGEEASVLRRRHRAVPHQRRHRVRAEEVRRRHRRPGVPPRVRRRDARRDRRPLVRPRLLLRPRTAASSASTA